MNVVDDNKLRQWLISVPPRTPSMFFQQYLPTRVGHVRRGSPGSWARTGGGSHSLIKAEAIDLHVIVEITALVDEFPERHLITALSIAAEGHSVLIEARDPHSADADGSLALPREQRVWCGHRHPYLVTTGHEEEPEEEKHQGHE